MISNIIENGINMLDSNTISTSNLVNKLSSDINKTLNIELSELEKENLGELLVKYHNNEIIKEDVLKYCDVAFNNSIVDYKVYNNSNNAKEELLSKSDNEIEIPQINEASFKDSYAYSGLKILCEQCPDAKIHIIYNENGEQNNPLLIKKLRELENTYKGTYFYERDKWFDYATKSYSYHTEGQIISSELAEVDSTNDIIEYA